MDEHPDLLTDLESSKTLCSLTERLYSFKNYLSEPNQKTITDLFYKTHNLFPKKVKGLLNIKEPANTLVSKYSDTESIIRGRQKYPVPMKILSNETMPANEYFKSIKIVLADGQTTRISQGMLAFFSETARNMLQNKNMQPPEKIVLEMLNHHQFDTLVAFLETGHCSLINYENAFPLLYAGDYLGIRALTLTAIRYIYANLDSKSIISLINFAAETHNQRLLVDLERQLSTIICSEINKPEVTDELKDLVEYFKENLMEPIRLDLSGTPITNEHLELLKSLPIYELVIRNCPDLTDDAFTALADYPRLQNLSTNHNAWIKNESLLKIPDNIKGLTLFGCLGVDGSGLSNLSETQVTELNLFGNTHLIDDDLAELPLQLSFLNLQMHKNLGEKTMERLSQMQHLNTLILSDSNFDPEHMEHLPKSLIHLDLTGCTLNDTTLAPLQALGSLKEINLKGTNISDKSLEEIPIHVEKINLVRCVRVTDEGIKTFADRTSLRSINLQQCPKITQDGVDPLKRNTDVIWQAPSPARMAMRAGKKL